MGLFLKEFTLSGAIFLPLRTDPHSEGKKIGTWSCFPCKCTIHHYLLIELTGCIHNEYTYYNSAFMMHIIVSPVGLFRAPDRGYHQACFNIWSSTLFYLTDSTYHLNADFHMSPFSFGECQEVFDVYGQYL